MNQLARLSFVTVARRIVLFIGLLLLFVTGIDLIRRLPAVAIYLPFEWVAFEVMEDIVLLVYALLCILIPFVYLYLSRVEGKLGKGIVGKGSDNEDICLTAEAVERVIVREVRKNVPQVLRVRECNVVQGRKGARVFINVAITEDARVPDVRRKVDQSVRQTLERVIGYSDSSEVRTKVSDVARAKEAPRKKPRKKKIERKEEAREELTVHE